MKEPRVPGSVLAISLLALAIAGAVNLLWPDALPQYSALMWLLALIPPFLLAYYRGWEGAALALAGGMVLLIGVEIGGSYLTDRAIRWWVVGGGIVLLIVVSLGAGTIANSLHRQTSDALRLAYADSLTGLPNRRILGIFLSQHFAAAQRGAELSMALFDIDGFKELNDRRGHSAGDEALLLVGRVLDQHTRSMNISGRHGGDEFLALLPGEPATGAYRYAERVRLAIADLELAHADRLSVSCGVASFRPSVSDPKQLLDAADRALYAAKKLGGNRVVANAAGVEPGTETPMLVLEEDGEVRKRDGATTIGPGRPSTETEALDRREST